MSPRKTGAEAKIERIMWFALIVVFLFMSNNEFDGAWTLVTVSSIILFFSFYQWRRRWSVSPITAVFAGIGLLAGAYGVYNPQLFDLSLLSFILILGVIGFGIVTNDA